MEKQYNPPNIPLPSRFSTSKLNTTSAGCAGLNLPDDREVNQTATYSPGKENGVISEMVSLRVEIYTHGQAVAAIIERLAPILEPDYPEGVTEEKQPAPVTEVAAMVRDLRLNVQGQTRVLQSVINRIGL